VPSEKADLVTKILKPQK